MTTQAISKSLPSCCHSSAAADRDKFSYLRLAERVSTVALTVLAAYADLTLFIPFLFLGGAVGIYQNLNTKNLTAGRENGISCSQGFLEQLTRVKLPPLVSLGINLAITYSHITHHARTFVPIIALFSGVQIVQKVSLATHST